MSRVCSVCGKGRMSGNAVSHSNRKTRRSWAPNVQKSKSIHRPAELKKLTFARIVFVPAKLTVRNSF